MATEQRLGQRILVPIDGSALSAEAIPFARALASEDAVITLLHVVVPDAPPSGLISGFEVAVEVETDREVDADATGLERAARQLSESMPGGQRVETLVVAGDPRERIERVIAEASPDLLVMASRGRGALGRFWFGSVADHFARHSPVAVAVLHPEDADGDRAMTELPSDVHPLRRVVLPIDGSARSAEASPVAADLAKRLSLPVLVLSSVDYVPAAPPVYGQTVGSAFGAAELLGDMEDNAGRWLEETRARLDAAGVAVEARQLSGPPAAAIERALGPGDLLVMASHEREGIDRLLSGSVTEQLVRGGKAPVLLVR